MTLAHYRQHFGSDLLAGITGAVAGAPQAMAFAIIAGVNPVYGLYTAIVSTIISAIMNSSVYMTVGPTNALALIVGTTLIRFDDGNELERLFMLTVMVGVFQTAFGLLRLGNITRFVSNAVMTGFITGAGVLIILGQLRELTGYESHAGGTLLLRTGDWLLNITASDPRTTAIGVLATAMIFVLHHTQLKSIATILTIGVTGVLVALLDWDSVMLVRDMSEIPVGLPAPIVPDPQFIPEIWTVALAMAVLGLVQSAGLSQNVSQPDGSLPSLNQDFVGQGVSNLVGGVFQGMPAGGSLSRTAVNLSGGAKTRMANVYAGLFVALILLVFGQLIERIPLAALAGHLIIAAFSLINLGRIKLVWRVGFQGQMPMAATFIAALLLPLEYSIYLGVVLSLGFYVYTSSSRITIQRLGQLPDGRFQETPPPKTLPDREPIIIAVYGNLFFAAARTLEENLPQCDHTEFPVVVLRLKGNHYLGSTGIRILERYAERLHTRGGVLILTGVGEQIYNELQQTGALSRFGKDNIFTEDDILLGSTTKGLARAHEWLAEQTQHFDAVEV